MADSVSANTLSKPLAERARHPRFTSETSIVRSHGQSTLMTVRVSAHSATSSGVRGPSANTKSRLGLACAIARKTTSVKSGRLKMSRTTGVSRPPFSSLFGIMNDTGAFASSCRIAHSCRRPEDRRVTHGPVLPGPIDRFQPPKTQRPSRMHIFPGVDFFASGRHRDEAQLSKNPATQVEVGPRNDEIAVGCDQPSQIPQAHFCALGRHMEKKIVREDDVVWPKARSE